MGGGSVAPALFDSGVASYSSGMSKTTLTQPDHLFAEAQAVLAGASPPRCGCTPTWDGRSTSTAARAISLRDRREALHRLQHVERRGAAGARSPGRETAVLHGVERGSSPPPRRHSTSGWRRGWSRSSRPPSASASPASAARSPSSRCASPATPPATKYLKFDGHFHGLTSRGSTGAPTRSTASAVVPSSGGVPVSGADDVVMAPWNDVEAFERAISAHGEEARGRLRADPLQRRLHSAEPGFLELLRARCSGTASSSSWTRCSPVSHPPRRRADAVRGHPGPDDARQGAGQWPAAGLCLRAGGPDAQSRPDRAGRPAGRTPGICSACWLLSPPSRS